MIKLVLRILKLERKKFPSIPSGFTHNTRFNFCSQFFFFGLERYPKYIYCVTNNPVDRGLKGKLKKYLQTIHLAEGFFDAPLILTRDSHLRGKRSLGKLSQSNPIPIPISFWAVTRVELKDRNLTVGGPDGEWWSKTAGPTAQNVAVDFHQNGLILLNNPSSFFSCTLLFAFPPRTISIK